MEMQNYKITKALQDQEVERVLSKVDSSGNVKTFRIDAKGDIIGECHNLRN